jgi:hypothetical protein
VEIFAVLSGLMYHYREMWQHRRPNNTKKVFVFSDSEYVVKCGNGEYGRKANLDLWCMLDKLLTMGYDVTFKWIPRDTHGLNKLADHWAGRTRGVVKKEVEALAQEVELFDVMPWEVDDDIPMTRDLERWRCTGCDAPLDDDDIECPICQTKRDP